MARNLSLRGNRKKQTWSYDVPSRGHVGFLYSPEKAITQLVTDAAARKITMSSARARKIIESVRYHSSKGYFNIRYQQGGTALLKRLFRSGRTTREAKRVVQIVSDVEEYIKISPSYWGTLWRGLNVNDRVYDRMKNSKPGSVIEISDYRKAISPWTSDYRQAVRLGRMLGKPKTIVFRIVDKTVPNSASVAHISSYGAVEKQVLIGNGAKFRVLKVIIPCRPYLQAERLAIIDGEVVENGKEPAGADDIRRDVAVPV